MKKNFIFQINRLVRAACILILLSAHLASRSQMVSINRNTGTPVVSIPVYSVNSGQAKVPISLVYIGTGVRPGNLEGILGTGWLLNAGGCITRELRDLPDDIKTDQSSNSRLGWLYNTNATKISNLTIANDNNTATCTDETTDINAIASNFSDNSDLEPDIFHISAPGLNCSIVYDQKNAVFRPVPYQDIIIGYTLNVAQNTIISFTITNDQGTVYTFDVAESAGQSTTTTNAPGIIYFKRGYTLYQYGIVYNQKWYLSKITDLYGNFVQLTYLNTYGTTTLTTPTAVITGLASNTSTRTVLYNTLLAYKPYYLANINSINKLNNTTVESASFSYTTTTDQQAELLHSISYKNRTELCTYGKVPGTKRDFLSYFGEAGCSANGLNYNSNLYKFDYNQIDFTTSNPNGLVDFATDGGGQDFWGYPNTGVDPNSCQIYVYPDNPSYPNLERYRFTPVPGYTGTVYTLNGEIKTVNATNVEIGSLLKITYPTGGSTSFTMEPNDYYDVSAATTTQGGGIRIKQMTDYDGLNTANNIVHNYSYLDPTTSQSSGKPVGMPAFAFTLPYTGTATGLDYWNYSTIRLSFSSSNQDESVIYGTVTEQQTGAGKTISTFTTPATFWDASAGTDWVPTVVNTGRLISGTCPAVGSVKNAKYIYPFIPNANYDFERGLLTSATTYNEAGNLVTQKTYTYTRSYASAIPITAFKFDDNSTTKGYAKYQILTYTSELLTREVNLLNNLNSTNTDTTQMRKTVNNIYYAGTNHKLPTKLEQVNTDGTTNTTYLQYIKDYAWNPATDFNAWRYLKDQNANLLTEKYNTLTRSGTELAFTGELTKYGTYGGSIPTSIYLPSQTLRFVSSTGIANFPTTQASHVSSGSLIYYSGYIPVANYSAYNYHGALLTKDDNFNNVNTQFVDYRTKLTVLSGLGASYNELAYSNFDGSDTAYGFLSTGGTINSTSYRSGSLSLTLPSTGSLSAGKNLKVNTKNYVFSTWINAAAAGTLTVSVYNSSAALFSSKTISFTASGSNWNYYETKLNTNGLTSTYTVKVTTNTSINIDDVLFYPENAEVNTFGYDYNIFYKTSETNTNGVAKYYGYDSYGRIQYVYDQDRNIVQKKTYVSANTIASGLISTSFTTSPTGSVPFGTTVNFTGSTLSGTCTPNTYYSYNFGDGTAPTTPSTSPTASHNFPTAGTFSVTITATNSIFGTKTATQPVTILMTPNSCQSGVWAYYGGVVYQLTCPPNPNDNTHSYFTVQTPSGMPAGHTLSYQWQIAYTSTGTGCGPTTWTNTGTNTYQFVKAFSTGSFCPYNVRCIVTDTNNGQQVTTNTMSVQNNGS